MNTFSMNIAITISHAYVPYAYTLLLSLPAHDSAKFQVYVLHRDLTDEDCNVLSSLSKLYDIHVHFICVPVSFSEAFTDTSAPAETCFRLCLPALLPDTLDRILYLEADMIATASLMPLYTLDFAGKKAACTTDASGNISASVLLLNLPLLHDTPDCPSAFRHALADGFDVHTIFRTSFCREDLLLLDSLEYNLSATAAFPNTVCMPPLCRTVSGFSTIRVKNPGTVIICTMTWNLSGGTMQKNPRIIRFFWNRQYRG